MINSVPVRGNSSSSLDQPDTSSIRIRQSRSHLYRRSSSFGSAPLLIPLSVQHDTSESARVRWLVLFLSCMLLFGNYYAYDNPAALNIPMQAWLDHSYDDWQYELNLLYSVYSFPNMFLPLIGGQMLDRIDSRRVLLFFSVFVCVGQTVFAYGVSIRSYAVMLVGRSKLFWKIGYESFVWDWWRVSWCCSSIDYFGLVQASRGCIRTWTEYATLIYHLLVDLCIARFGSVVNAIVSPRIEKQVGVVGAVWMGSFMCYVSFACAVMLVVIMTMHPLDNSKRGQSSATVSGSKLEPTWNFRSLYCLPKSFWLICLICILLYGTV